MPFLNSSTPGVISASKEFWPPENVILHGSWESRIKGIFVFIALLFGIHICLLGILASWCSLRVMRASDQGYLAFDDWLVGILKAWKSDNSSVLRPSAEGLCDYRWAILDFMMPWNCKSCRVVRPWAQGYKASSGNLNSILTSWKCDYSIVIRPSTERYLASTKCLYGILMAWKWDSSRGMRSLVPVEKLYVNLAG
jgi:hypothetical protein